MLYSLFYGKGTLLLPKLMLIIMIVLSLVGQKCSLQPEIVAKKPKIHYLRPCIIVQ